jgi:hypothetical protein
MEAAASTRRWRGRACAGKTGRYPFTGDLHSAPKQREGRGEGGLDNVSGRGRHLRRATQAGPTRASTGRDTPQSRAPRCLGASVASSGVASGCGVRLRPDVEAVGATRVAKDVGAGRTASRARSRSRAPVDVWTPVNKRLTALFSKKLNRSALQCK